MAWLSVGVSNDDLCDKLIEHGVLKNEQIIAAFQHADRGDFVQEEDRELAYQDRPYKRGPLHLSAPHMYVSVLEALDLRRGQAFLNIGSGSGYLSCLASFLLGSTGICHGVEINSTLVSHSKKCIAEWQRKMKGNEEVSSCNCNDTTNIFSSISKVSPSISDIVICEGNCFNINVRIGNGLTYDRIYVGAGCPDEKKEYFYSLLSDNGIIVLPVLENNEMILVRKFAGNVYSQRHIANVHFAPLLDIPLFQSSRFELNNYDRRIRSTSVSEIEQEILSTEDEVLVVETEFEMRNISTNDSNESTSTHQVVELPTMIWGPNKATHMQFSQHFREVVKMVLLLTHSRSLETNSRDNKPSTLCGQVPVAVWFHILSFASRDWFLPHRSPVERLQIELAAERKLRLRAEEKLSRAVNGKRAAERERDLLRIVVARLSQHRGGGISYYEEDEYEEEEVEEVVEEDEADEDDSEVESEDEIESDEEEVLLHDINDEFVQLPTDQDANRIDANNTQSQEDVFVTIESVDKVDDSPRNNQPLFEVLQKSAFIVSRESTVEQSFSAILPTYQVSQSIATDRLHEFSESLEECLPFRNHSNSSEDTSTTGESEDSRDSLSKSFSAYDDHDNSCKLLESGRECQCKIDKKIVFDVSNTDSEDEK